MIQASVESRSVTTAPFAKQTALIEMGLALLLGAAAFFLYLRTLAPVVLTGDSGEFQALVYLLGNTHPTGYPIYLLLAHPFTWLPIESVAYRVNLFSAFMAGITVGLTYLGGRLLTDRRMAAVVGTAALAVSATLWSQAVIAEVYSAGAAFLIAILVLVLAWRRSGRVLFLFVAGLLGGLSLGIHMTVVLVAPAVLVYLLLTARKDRTAWLYATSGALIGVIVFVAAFLYLDWRAPAADFISAAIQPSRSVWGLAETDLDSPWERFLFSLTGRQFQDRMFQAEALGKNIWRYATGLKDEFQPVALLLTIPGLMWLVRRRPYESVLIGGALLAQWIYTFSYNIWDIYVFFIPGYVLLALLVTSGVAALDLSLRGLLAHRYTAAPPVATVLLGLLLLGVTAWPALSSRWPDVTAGRVANFKFDGYPVDRFNMTGLHNQVTAIVADLPPDAIVFSRWNELYPLYYAAHVEQGRSDLTFLEEKPYRAGAVSENSTIQFVAARIANHPIYFTECLPELTDAGYGCEPVRFGAVRYQQIQQR